MAQASGRPHYSIQAVLVYIAAGVALGMVGWALFIHDGGTSNPAAGKPPATKGSHR